MYSERILELFKNPINAGGLQGANGVGKYVDETCGDAVKLYLKIDENKIITEARFKAIGSVGTIVAGSAICSCLLDCSVLEALNITKERIFEVTGVYPEDKEYCVQFAINALNNAINAYNVNLEKEQKKQKDNKTEKKPVEQKQLPKLEKEIPQEATERRNKSAAKAAFDALFDI